MYLVRPKYSPNDYIAQESHKECIAERYTGISKSSIVPVLHESLAYGKGDLKIRLTNSIS